MYNNTTRSIDLKIEDYERPDFKVHLKKGNHYTLMIRKEGYISKRMEAFVDVKGCILCFEGIGDVRPGVTDNLTNQNSFGTLLANVELERIYPGKEIKVNTIYYAPSSAKLSQKAKIELDKLKLFMTDNPNLLIELGSHTDSRGSAASNQKLSLERAQAAVNYILEDGSIEAFRLEAKGYGFSKVLNHCKPGVKCSKSEHAVNRRTELKLMGVLSNDQILPKSLASMKQLEHMDDLLAEIQKEGVVEIPGDESYSKQKENNTDLLEKEKADFERESKNVQEEVNETVKQIFEEEEKVKPAKSISELTTEELVTEPNPVSSAPTEIQSNEIIEDETELDKELMDTDPIKISNDDNSWMRGHKIVALESKEKLDADHFIFQDFKKVNVMVSPMSNKYMYIIGEFQSEIQAQKYLDEKLSKKYSNAYLIGF